MFKMFSITAVAVSFFAFAALAASPADKPVDQDGEHCDRTITYDALVKAWPKERIQELEDGKQLVTFVKAKSGFEKGYVFKIAKYDAELVMGVYSSCHEHAGKNGMGDFIKRSEVKSPDVNNPGNPFRVEYEQHTPVFANGVYIMENTVRAEEGGYILSSKLTASNDSDFAPRWADGYLRVTPHSGGRVFVVACNYMVPRDPGMFAGSFRDTARDRLKASGGNLMNWINRVSADRGKSDAYRARLQGFVGH